MFGYRGGLFVLSVKKLFKNSKIIPASGINTLDDLLMSNDNPQKIEQILLAIYGASNDMLQKVLIRDVARFRGIQIEEITPIGDAA
jgi:hypothetical protein